MIMNSERDRADSLQENDKLLSLFYTSENNFVTEYKRLYSGNPKAKDFYFEVLLKMKDAVIQDKEKDFERLCSLLKCVRTADITTEAFPHDPKNPLIGTNFIILACKFNRPEILKYLFSSPCKVLSILPTPDPEHLDEEKHSAFYYAIRWGSISLFTELVEQWPGLSFTSNPGKLDEILSKVYCELKLKKVRLSDEIEVLVEKKLVDLNFFSQNSVPVENSENRLRNIKERVELVIKEIKFLVSKYSRADVDDKFLFIARFIAQNICILKRQLKSTYSILPWEEVEFCLVTFVLSQRKRQEKNLFHNLTLSKSKILNYLENFAEKLEDKSFFGEKVNVDKLDELPMVKRNQIVQNIIKNNPELEGLYEDYEKVRDVCSLERISDYLKLVAAANSKESEGKLIISRALQGIGEYFKDTLESPKLSNTMKELLLSSLPQNTRKIIIDLRNALSHSYSLSKRIEIEEKADVSFFIGIQNDAKIIGSVVSNILCRIRMESVETLLRKISSSENLVEVLAIAKRFKNLDLKQITPEGSKMAKQERLEQLVEELSSNIIDMTNVEGNVFKKIDRILKSAHARSADVKVKYAKGLAALSDIFIALNENKMETNSFIKIKSSVDQVLNNITSTIEPCKLQEIFQLLAKILERAKFEHESESEINRLMVKILYEIESTDIKCIEKLRKNLIGKKSMFHFDGQKNISNTGKKKNRNILKMRISKLKHFLNTHGFEGQATDQLTSFVKQKELRPIIEMLVLDIMSILSDSGKCQECNFYLDDYVPLLTGKGLRDHLAHDNALVDLSSHDPYLAVLLNAQKLINAGDLFQSQKKIGKLVADNPSVLRAKYAEELAILTNQEKMFSALKEGNMPVLCDCLKEGADINARSGNMRTAVHFAAMGSNIEILDFTINQSSSLNVKDRNGQTPLHIAAEHGNQDIVDFLSNKASLPVDDTDNYHRTPMHVAAKNGHKEAVRVLLKNKACTSAKDFTGSSPLHCAARNNYIDVVKIILESEESVDFNETADGCTSLHLAAGNGFLDMVNFLLSKKADVNAQNDNDETPLHASAMNGHLEVVEALIKQGANLNVRTVDGRTPLFYAVENCQEQTVKFLLQQGADANIFEVRNGYRPLHIAARNGYEEITKALLESKGNANIGSFSGETPLHFAASNGCLKIVDALLKYTADINATNILISTPLHNAALNGHSEVVEYLIEKGAGICARNAIKETPLHVAASEGHKNVVEILIKHKSPIEALDINGNRPLHVAALDGRINVVRTLLRSRAEVNAKNFGGMTPILPAVLSGCCDTVKLLVEHKANVNIIVDNDISPLKLALSVGHLSIAEFLLEKKANPAIFKDRSFFQSAVSGISKEVVELFIAKGANVNQKLGNSTPLITAVRYNRVEIVKLLLEKGANIDGVFSEPLFLAIYVGYVDIIETLLKKGARVDLIAPENMTLLHVAAEKGDERTVSMLLGKGAKVNALTENYETPLYLAACGGHVEIVKMLIAHKANVNIHHANVQERHPFRKTPLHIALDQNDMHLVELILESNEVDTETEYFNGSTALHDAAEYCNLEIVKLLVNYGFDIKAVDNEGSNPIHRAANAGKKEIVQFFLDKGLSIDETDTAGQTLLHHAARSGRLEVVNYLIECGADVNRKDFKGLSPMDVSLAHFDFKETAKTLLRKGASFRTVIQSEQTPNFFYEGNIKLLKSTDTLFESLTKKNLQKFKSSIEAGAFIDAKHPKYGTPLHYAARLGNKDAVLALLQEGAIYNCISHTRQTPLDLATDKRIISLLKKVDKAFRNVRKGEVGVISDLQKITDAEIVKAIMRARNDENRTLVVAAIYSKFPAVDRLKEIFQGNMSIETAKALFISPQEGFQESIDTLKRLLNKRKEILGPDNPGTLDVQVAIAEINFKQENYDEALIILSEAYNKQVEILGTNNKDTLCAKRLKALIFFNQDEIDDSFTIFQEVYEIQKELLGPDHEDTIKTLFYIASAMARLGKYGEAFSISKKVFEIRKETLGEFHVDTLKARNNMGLELASQEKHEEALEILQEVLAKMIVVLGMQHSDTFHTLGTIAAVLSSQYQSPNHSALKVFREVLAAQRRFSSPVQLDITDLQSRIVEKFVFQAKCSGAFRAFSAVLQQKGYLLSDHPSVTIAEKAKEEIHLVMESTSWNMSKVFQYVKDGLNVAAEYNDFASVSAFLKGGADVNGKGDSGSTPLHHATDKGHVTVVKLLLSYGADPSEVTNKGNTPLHLAVNKPYKEIVEILLRNVAPDKVNDFINIDTTGTGSTALHVAAKKGFVDIVKSLLKHGAIYNVRNKKNETPLDIATDQHIVTILKTTDELFVDLENGVTQNIRSRLNKMAPDEYDSVMNAKNYKGITLLQAGSSREHILPS